MIDGSILRGCLWLQWLSEIPGLGAAVMLVVSWLPTVLLGYCLLLCCFH